MRSTITTCGCLTLLAAWSLALHAAQAQDEPRKPLPKDESGERDEDFFGDERIGPRRKLRPDDARPKEARPKESSRGDDEPRPKPRGKLEPKQFDGEPKPKPFDGPGRNGPGRGGPFGGPGMGGPGLGGGGLGGPRFRDVERLKQDDPELYKLIELDRELAIKTDELALRFRRASTEQRTAIRKELEDTITKHFTARQARRALELKRLEEQLGRLREAMQKRDTAKKEIIDRRIRQLTGEDGALDF